MLFTKAYPFRPCDVTKYLVSDMVGFIAKAISIITLEVYGKTYCHNIVLLYRLWNFPSLDKEGWRVAPGWFETVIPQVRQERYISNRHG
jgi:hypothetical protein